MPNQALAPVQYGLIAINLLVSAGLGAGGANTSLAARVRRDACEQVGRECGLVAPARRLLDAGHTFQLPGALVRLPAQRAARGVNGLGFLHGGLRCWALAPAPTLRPTAWRPRSAPCSCSRSQNLCWSARRRSRSRQRRVSPRRRWSPKRHWCRRPPARCRHAGGSSFCP